MYVKTCPHCGRPSYSAASDRHWPCPTCGGDLSSVEARVVTDPVPGNAPWEPAPPMASSEPSSRRRLRLVDVAWRPVDGGPSRAEVRLRHPTDTEHSGSAEANFPETPVERLVAEATLRAVEHYIAAMGIGLRFSIRSVYVVDAPTGPFVTVTVGFADQTIDRPAEPEFAGAALIRGTPHLAASKAVLQSVNRYLDRFN